MNIFPEWTKESSNGIYPRWMLGVATALTRVVEKVFKASRVVMNKILNSRL